MSKVIPNTVLDIVFLIARIIIHLPEDLPTLQGYYYTHFKWRLLCTVYGIDENHLSQVLKTVKSDYDWLKHLSKDGKYYPFSLREKITLIVKIILNLNTDDRNLILAIYYCNGNIDDVISKSDGKYSRTYIYHFLSIKIKTPYLSVLDKGKAA